MTAATPTTRPIAGRFLFVLRGGYLPGSIDGANVSLHALCRRLLGIGAEPIVVCASDPAMPEAATAPAEDLGYSVLRLADPLRAVGEMAMHLKPAAVILCNAVSAAQAAAIAEQSRRVLHLYLVGGTFGELLSAEHSARLLRFAANSRFLVRISELLLDTPVAHIPSIVEPQQYRCNPAGDAVLFVNPTPAKGFHIAAAVARLLPGRRFIFLRSWRDHPSFRVHDVQMPNVECLPSTGDMRAMYARTKLVLMPSVLDEGFGRTAAEAQVSGIPCVVSDRGGLPEMAGPGGVIVPITAPIEHWRDAVDGVLADPGRYAALSRAARAHAARAEMAPEQIVERFLEFVAA